MWYDYVLVGMLREKGILLQLEEYRFGRAVKCVHRTTKTEPRGKRGGGMRLCRFNAVGITVSSTQEGTKIR